MSTGRTRSHWLAGQPGARLHLSALLALLLAVLVASAICPVDSHAAWLRNQGVNVLVTTPRSVSPRAFTTRVYWFNNDDGVERSGTMRGNKTRTVFRIPNGQYDSSGSPLYRRVTYAAFVRYMRAAHRTKVPGDVDYVWLTTSSGTKYRYIRQITANDFAE